MEIELYGGPADGVVLVVPDDTKIWIVSTPKMSGAEFLALEQQDPAVTLAPPQQLGYAATKQYSSQSGAKKFQFVGVRVRP